MQIYTGTQIKQWDTYTIEHEPIRSIDLMERAAGVISEAIVQRYGKERPVVVFAGPGNNGGDALAVARMLAGKGYSVEVYLFNINKSLSDDCAENMKRLHGSKNLKRFVEVIDNFTPPVLNDNSIVVDGLFGSGLNKPLSGGFAALVKVINSSPATVVSIDMPSGLMTEDNTQNNRQGIIHAHLTFTLGQKKLAMYLADNESFLGEVVVLDIGLSEEFTQRYKSAYYLLDENYIKGLLRGRNPFSHKGTMGHSLLIAGSYGMAGAAILASLAALRSGVGKLTIHTPICNNDILQVAIPEAVLHHDKNSTIFAEVEDTTDYDSVAIGPGLGQQEMTAIALRNQLPRIQCPIVLDADALNILASHRPWISQLPRNLILTPHPTEFDRLAGLQSNGSFDRLSKAVEMASELHSYIILKGHYSALCCPEGEVYFNSTGNAGMATAGMGDVLTGIICGLLGRGYAHKEACLVGMYLHGLAGDLAKEELGEESLIASDVINKLSFAFQRLYNKEND